MGFGTYSVTSSTMRGKANTAATAGLTLSASNAVLFKAREVNNAMSPFNIGVRESRDSAEHPNSLAIVLGLDVTGSMGSIPNFLIKDGLPAIMEKIMKGGEADPQVLFVGVGDHECDSAPLQVGQFESSDDLLDKWLKDTYLEGGGGGNNGESYSLAWYFAALYTSTDCFEKRGRKGLLFTIGDEPVLEYVPKHSLQNLFGKGQFQSYSSRELLDMAREKYDVYHINVKETTSGSRQSVIDGWKQLMSDNLIVVEKHKDIAQVIADTVLKLKGKKVESSNEDEVLL
jgi:hypothetical protein